MSTTIPLPLLARLRAHDLLGPARPAAPRATAAPNPDTNANPVLRRLRDAWRAWRRHRAQRATRHALLQLDDRTLRDIGIVRAEVESAAAEAHGGVAPTRSRLLRHVGPMFG
jgi:uncharacterized protein YjiS (DUF1127 family)